MSEKKQNNNFGRRTFFLDILRNKNIIFLFVMVCFSCKSDVVIKNNNLIASTKKECDLDEMKKDLSYLDGYKCGKILGEQGQVGVFIVAPENCEKKKLWYSGFREGEKEGMERFLTESHGKGRK